MNYGGRGHLGKRGPAMLQSHVPGIAGELVRRLCELAGGDDSQP